MSVLPSPCSILTAPELLLVVLLLVVAAVLSADA